MRLTDHAARVIAGDSRINSSGYRQLFLPWHPAARSNGFVYEHRVLMERIVGRFLRPDEHVHHRNGDTLDNQIENLELLSAAEHRATHAEIPDEHVAELLRRGVGSTEIASLGVSTHRTVRIRRELLARGETVTVAPRDRTHCPRGHPYTTENTYYPPGGGRICRTCKTEGQREYRRALREAGS